MERDGFFLFRNIFDAGKTLKKKEQREFYFAVLTYAFDGNTENELKGEALGMFSLILPSLAKSRAKAQAGSKGGRSKAQANGKQNESKSDSKQPSKTQAIKNKELENKELENTPPISPQGDGARVAPQAKPKQRRTSVKPEKRPYGSFGNVMLTDDEHAKLTPAELGLIEELSCYIESSGKKYASHYATLLNWARRRGEEARGKTRHGEDDHVNDSFTDADIESVVEVL